MYNCIVFFDDLSYLPHSYDGIYHTTFMQEIEVNFDGLKYFNVPVDVLVLIVPVSGRCLVFILM